MTARSAGLLLYRIGVTGAVDVLIAHPGGPYWAARDEGAWSVPKGEYGPGDDALATAYREFGEETGLAAPAGDALCLGDVRQPGGKRVTVWALEGDVDLSRTSSNTFELEWPPGSGRRQRYPEVDRLEWVPLDVARAKLLAAQVPYLDRLLEALEPQ
jgi:predicted NUDIX family NTP pyrophosphohydrolase